MKIRHKFFVLLTGMFVCLLTAANSMADIAVEYRIEQTSFKISELTHICS